MNDKEIMDEIKRHEGYSDTVYYDSVGVPTVGYGHALLQGSKIPAVVADLLFEQDFNIAKKDYEILANRWGLDISPVRRAVLINMLFNMGMARVSKFQKMLTALQEKNFDKAADEMLDSRWATQVGRRADELAKTMREGA
jgi:lysozyme